jgi:hypothetical protein
MDLEAAADVQRLAGLAQLAHVRHALPHDRRELAGAIAQRELQELRAVAFGARLDGPDEEDLVELLAIGEVADEHVDNRREARGRQTV